MSNIISLVWYLTPTSGDVAAESNYIFIALSVCLVGYGCEQEILLMAVIIVVSIAWLYYNKELIITWIHLACALSGCSDVSSALSILDYLPQNQRCVFVGCMNWLL